MSSGKVASWEQFYDGSRSFQFVAEATKMPIDQINFILAQLAAVALSFVLRTRLPALSCVDGGTAEQLQQQQKRTVSRHQFALTSGIFITYFCFGKQVLLALALALTCYLLLLLLPAATLHRATLAVCMVLLSAAHLYRQTLQQAVFVIDITGPLMVMVQRATAVAFGLHDGRARKGQEMTALQRDHAIRERPSLLEYMSYLLNFTSILAGPFLMFRDYQDYMSGCDDYTRAVMLQRSVEQVQAEQLRLKKKVVSSDCHNNTDTTADPSAGDTGVMSLSNDTCSGGDVAVLPLSPGREACRKLLLGGLFALSTVALAPLFPVTSLTGSAFSSSSFTRKLWLVVLTTTLARHLYYTAWLLAESACNMGGLGYTGVKGGQHTWRGASNVDIMGVELGSSLRTTLDSWNSKTVIWLRYAAYERLPAMYQVAGTYLLSSSWHGFYPGYYCTFFTAGLGTVAARTARRCLRFRVLSMAGGESSYLMMIYHVATWFMTRLVLSYSTFSFVLLSGGPSLMVYWDLGFYMHFLCLLCIFVLPAVLPPPRRAAAAAPASGGPEQAALVEEKKEL